MVIVVRIKQSNTYKVPSGNSLVVQWLGLCISTAEDKGSIPGQKTKILQAIQHSQI